MPELEDVDEDETSAQTETSERTHFTGINLIEEVRS